MSEKPKKPEWVSGQKYLYKGATDWESEIFPQYHADLIAWQEDRIAELEKALRTALALITETEKNLGTELRGVTYYECRKALGL